MHFLAFLAASLAIAPTALAQFAGYYRIVSALPDSTKLMTFNNDTKKITSQDRFETLQSQLWYITHDPSGYAVIANREGGIVTAAAGYTTDPNLDATQAQGLSFAPNTAASQAWRINRLSDGFYEFESMKFAGQVLDIRNASTTDSAQIIMHPRYGAPNGNQKWRIVKPLIEIITF